MFLSCLTLVLIPPLHAFESNGTKVTVQYVAGGSSSERTTYWQTDRRRIEYRNSVGDRLGPHLAVITRCDLGKVFELNLDSSQYTSNSYPPKPLTKEELRARGLEGRRLSFSEKPTIRIEIKTFDAGERRQMFGHTARHVITTRKETPLEGSRANPQESTMDGWYIDLDQHITCDPDYGLKGNTRSFGFALIASPSSRNQIIGKPELVSIGKPETGFALEGITTSDNTYTSADGTVKHAISRSEARVTELYEGPLDPSLFEVHHGFRQVREIDRSPSPSSSNGVADLWQRMKYTISRWFSSN